MLLKMAFRPLHIPIIPCRIAQAMQNAGIPVQSVRRFVKSATRSAIQKSSSLSSGSSQASSGSTGFARIWELLKGVEWKRFIMGDFSVPYSYKRLIHLKIRDRVPLNSDLVYAYRIEGMIWFAIVSANIAFAVITYRVIAVFYRNWDKISPKRPSKNPFRRALQYFNIVKEPVIGWIFVVIMTVIMHKARNRMILRLYYDRNKDLFHIVTFSPMGLWRRIAVKPGTAKPLPKTESISGIFGNSYLVNDNGSLRQKLITSPASFLMPWYYNHLFGLPNSAVDPLKQIYLATPKEAFEFPDESEELKLTKINAQRLEQVRKSAGFLSKLK